MVYLISCVKAKIDMLNIAKVN